MKYAFVTGGTSGLGECLCKSLLKKGYRVIIGYYNNKEKALELVNSLSNSISCYIDICNEKCVKNIFEKYNVEILINNACLCNDNCIEDKSFDEFMDVVKTNLGGTYLMCKYALKAKYIINISSRDGIDTYNPISLDYSSSKAGIINLSKNLSLYYKDKYIYCVCPGWINTDGVMNMNPNYLDSELKRIGQKKLLNKENVANEIVSLINSDRKSGSVVIIDEKE